MPPSRTERHGQAEEVLRRCLVGAGDVTLRDDRCATANRQRIASSRSSFFRHRIVYLKVGRSRHFIRQKCRFSPPHGEAARHSRLPFSGGPGSSAWRKSPDIQALPEGATTVADRGFNAAGSQRTIRCSTVGRHHDWHKAKRCAVGSSLPNPKRCAVGKSDAMRCRLACSLVRRHGRLRLAHLAAERLDLGPGGR